MRGRKPIWFGLPEARRGEAPRGVQEGTESSPGDALCRTPGYSHLAQPAEPPYADPHVRWCGRGGQATVPPIPIGDEPCVFGFTLSPAVQMIFSPTAFACVNKYR